MKICLLGLDNLAVLAPYYGRDRVGGESVQQTLLARALVRRGHAVSMVVADGGQADGAEFDGIRTFAAYRPGAGWPVVRFLHPRWTGLWAALKQADADCYYTSCAGMQVGLLALFGARRGRPFVFRAASDTDCDPRKLLVHYARDRWLYGFGLRRAHAILVQSQAQAAELHANYGLASRVADMLVEPAVGDAVARDIDVLWLGNFRALKRPDRILRLASDLPRGSIHIAGGSSPGEEALYREVRREALARPNVRFHGRLDYAKAAALFGRARLLVNTSDIEGFPNTYVQAWSHGVPVVTRIDPDGIIRREGLGIVVANAQELLEAVRSLLEDADRWNAASGRCRAYAAREHDEERVIAPYLEAFEQALRPDSTGTRPRLPGTPRHA